VGIQTSNLSVFDPAGSSSKYLQLQQYIIMLKCHVDIKLHYCNKTFTITTVYNYAEMSRRNQTPLLQHNFYSVLVSNFNFINRTWSIKIKSDKVSCLHTNNYTINYGISMMFDQEHFNIVPVTVSRWQYL
jgi:hypothetical protein